MPLSAALKILKSRGSLDEEAMADAMRHIMSGNVSEEDLATFLTLLSYRGETAAELAGAARILREKAAMIHAPEGTVDCCGTGGDGIGTYNISTAVALTAAACGVPVAKHGHRASSSKSGAADVLEALGVNLDLPAAALEEALQRFNFAFLMAPYHHKAMSHVMPVRKKLGFRTIFNLLGPLANPAGAKIQLMGVYDRRWLNPLAETLQRLGAQAAWIVHGRDGLDEITTTAATDIAMMGDNGITENTLTPASFGLPVALPASLKGGDARYNAAALRKLLACESSAYRDIVLANTAAVLVLAHKAADLPAGVQIAAQAIDSHKAEETLESYTAFTRSMNQL